MRRRRRVSGGCVKIINKIQNLPFPQNKILRVRCTKNYGDGRTVYSDKAYFIPVLDQPLSSNRYYVIPAGWKYKGKHSTSVVVGKWYIPFMFIKEEGTSSKDQMKNSMFYEIYLEQMWDEIHMETTTVSGKEAATRVADGLKWVSGPPNSTGVGLSMAVVDKMKWEACRGGWIEGKEKDVRVGRMEEFEGVNGWRKFGCYMLVERFVLRRMDGSLVLTYDFNQTHLIQSKWE
ncbi:uncharacterized protein LOC131217342 [Magnolia sinica]|uniref:uncharacterized protein LOC131217342 n=1 Tax=Magnolia sinica TaxID=86752 RepID=UPI002658ED09|nr:uncharacterized protein LOC131217342 [Magnolia sinica]